MSFLTNYADGFKFHIFRSMTARIAKTSKGKKVYYDWSETFRIITPEGVKYDFTNHQDAATFLANQRDNLVLA